MAPVGRPPGRHGWTESEQGRLIQPVRPAFGRRPATRRLAEALAFAAIGGNGAELPVLVEYVIVAEALGQLAGLGVAEPDPVARPQLPGGRAADRRLDLA